MDVIKRISSSSIELARDDKELIAEVLSRSALSPNHLARYLGTSYASMMRWTRGDSKLSEQSRRRLQAALDKVKQGILLNPEETVDTQIFASRGARQSYRSLPLFQTTHEIGFSDQPQGPILPRLRTGQFWGNGANQLSAILADHHVPAATLSHPLADGISAGKNTYTYDAHTYHTKVPPQGIAEVIQKYLPQGGLVLDPFAGSGMTGVAALTLGVDVVLNELSPAAGFISDRFTTSCDPSRLEAATRQLMDRLNSLRRRLYSTICRRCGKPTEILFTVFSYKVKCYECENEFLLWDHCRKYGQSVREHKILSAFPCPSCEATIKKSRLRRTTPLPVLLGYKCCSARQEEHPLSQKDIDLIESIEGGNDLEEGYVPRTEIPDGVNLSQPKRHGLTSIDRLYTKRNLSALSHIWRAIHQIQDDQIAGFLAFVFTSLYQRVTRLSEFRFWGGSSNTANFNVPFIFNEANVFVSFERKARSIQDHLETTAQHYKSRCIVRTGSATDLCFLPDKSCDLIFTDPPFGSNINYSEMNIIWESWLGSFTDAANEAIINRFQDKDVISYRNLMLLSLKECHRVLRPNSWMILVFMNSSHAVWRALNDAVESAGFSVKRVDIFDKQHGTFKQFVSENTAGYDLMLHCQKNDTPGVTALVGERDDNVEVVSEFIRTRLDRIPMQPFLHVARGEEVDYRMLYSQFLKESILGKGSMPDFAKFREVAASLLKEFQN